MQLEKFRTHTQRRAFLSQLGVGLGAAALSMMLRADSEIASTGPRLSEYKGLSGMVQLPAKAKRVIFLCMAGGPSHLETFDYKPKLIKLHGQPMPESYTKGQPIAQLQGKELKVHAP